MKIFSGTSSWPLPKPWNFILDAPCQPIKVWSTFKTLTALLEWHILCLSIFWCHHYLYPEFPKPHSILCPNDRLLVSVQLVILKNVLNLLGWYWSPPYRFQVYIPLIHHLYITRYVHHPVGSWLFLGSWSVLFLLLDLWLFNPSVSSTQGTVALF